MERDIRKAAVYQVVNRMAISEEYDKIYSLMDEAYKRFDKRVNRKKAALINWRLRKYGMLRKAFTLEYCDIYETVNGHEYFSQPIGIEICARLTNEPCNKVWICNLYHMETKFVGNDGVLFAEDKVKAIMTFKFK